MRDDFLTRDWANDHSKMSDGVDVLVHKLIAKFDAIFAALNRAQFDAPWRRPAKRGRLGY